MGSDIFTGRTACRWVWGRAALGSGPPKCPWADIDNSSKLLHHGSGMSKVITPHFEKLIDRFVASGRFNNKSEVIRAGLRLLEDQEAAAAAGASRDDLSRMIQTALTDPRPLIPARNLLRRRQRR